jgi:hypothetical protein
MNQNALIVFALVLILSLPLAAAEPPTQTEIVELVNANLRAAQASNVPAILTTIHPESVSQSAVEQMAEQLKAYKLKYEATSVSFVAMAGDYALIRVVQRTTKVKGPDFLDNEIDGIWALRQDGTAWKYWSQMTLKFRAIGPSGSAGQ